jgi:hypothetical protein
LRNSARAELAPIAKLPLVFLVRLVVKSVAPFPPDAVIHHKAHQEHQALAA